MESKKQTKHKNLELVDTENRLVIARGGDRVKEWGGERAKWAKEVKSMNSSYRVNHGHVMYSVRNTVDNIVTTLVTDGN